MVPFPEHLPITPGSLKGSGSSPMVTSCESRPGTPGNDASLVRPTDKKPETGFKNLELNKTWSELNKYLG